MFQQRNYRKISNIRRTKSQHLNDSHLVLQFSLLNPLLTREWRCSWSSADRRCSNYIWVVNDYIPYKGATYIRDLTVCDSNTIITSKRCFDMMIVLVPWKRYFYAKTLVRLHNNCSRTTILRPMSMKKMLGIWIRFYTAVSSARRSRHSNNLAMNLLLRSRNLDNSWQLPVSWPSETSWPNKCFFVSGIEGRLVLFVMKSWSLTLLVVRTYIPGEPF